MNTKHDDYAMIIGDDLQKGYFSSNRNTADDDIYSVNFTDGLNLNKRIEGLAIDKNGNPLKEIKISLYNENGYLIDSSKTESDGMFSFYADDDQSFKLVGSNKKFQDGITTTDTKGDEYIINADVIMLQEPKKEVTEEVITEIQQVITVDNSKNITFKPIYFEFNKYNINSAAAKVLDQLIVVMNQNPEMIVELSSYTDCRDTESYNQTLSQNRANATLNYIQSRITNPSRISGIGSGESDTVNGCDGEGDVISNCSEDQHSKNRRTEFVVVMITTSSNQ